MERINEIQLSLKKLSRERFTLLKTHLVGGKTVVLCVTKMYI